MSNDGLKLPFLVMSKYHLSASKAREAAAKLYTTVSGKPVPTTEWDKAIIGIESNGISKFRMSLSDMVNEIREKGTVIELHRFLDMKDGVFGGSCIESAIWHRRTASAHAQGT